MSQMLAHSYCETRIGLMETTIEEKRARMGYLGSVLKENCDSVPSDQLKNVNLHDAKDSDSSCDDGVIFEGVNRLNEFVLYPNKEAKEIYGRANYT